MEAMGSDIHRGLNSINVQLSTICSNVKEIESKAAEAAYLGRSHRDAIKGLDSQITLMGDRVKMLEEKSLKQEPYWGLLKRYFPLIVGAVIVMSVFSVAFFNVAGEKVVDIMSGRPPLTGYKNE